MTTLADLRAGLRVLLNDTAAEGYLWNDGTLDLHLNDAIRNYSRYFPRHREVTIAMVAGQREYDLPADCLAVVKVELVGTEGRVPLLEGDGTRSQAGACSYEVYGGKLVLWPTPTEPGQSIAVRHLAPHAALALDGDLSTAPAADEDLLLTYAASRVLQTLLSEEAKRRRFESQSGQPTRGVANLYWEQYERGIGIRTARVRMGRLSAL